MDFEQVLNEMWNAALCANPEAFALLQNAEGELTFAATAVDTASTAQSAFKNNTEFPVMVWCRLETPAGSPGALFLARDKQRATAGRGAVARYGSGLGVGVVLPPGEELWVAVSGAESARVVVVTLPMTGRRLLGLRPDDRNEGCR